MNSPSVPNNSLADLAKMIRIPTSVTKAQWELVTLPESKSSDLPGPSDYVCLVALLQLPQTDSLALSEIPASNSIQKQFARQWLPKSASAAITNLGVGKKVFDVKSWVIRKNVRSYGIATPDG